MFNDGYEMLCQYIVDHPHTVDVGSNAFCDCAELLGKQADEARFSAKAKE